MHQGQPNVEEKLSKKLQQVYQDVYLLGRKMGWGYEETMSMPLYELHMFANILRRELEGQQKEIEESKREAERAKRQPRKRY